MPARAPSDRELEKRIRRALAADKALGGAARDVKLKVEKGKATLSGETASDAEKRRLLDDAARVAGSKNVIDAISISPRR